MAPVIRVEATDPDGLRVLVPTAAATTATCGVDLPRGVLWHLAAEGAVAEACSIRTPSGWVTTTGTLLVLVDGTGWTYAMCLDGVATVERRAEGDQRRLCAGEIGRGKVGTTGFEIARVGVDAVGVRGCGPPAASSRSDGALTAGSHRRLLSAPERARGRWP